MVRSGCLWRSDGKRVFGASGMQSERFGEKRFFGSGGRQLHGLRGVRVQESDELSLAGSMRVCRWPMGLSVPVCMSATIRSRMALMENGSSTCTGRFPGMARDSADKRCVRVRPISCRASCAIATAWSRPHASAPALVGEELARRSLTQKDETAWRAAPSISRYYSMLGSVRWRAHLENQGKSAVKKSTAPGDSMRV